MHGYIIDCMLPRVPCVSDREGEEALEPVRRSSGGSGSVYYSCIVEEPSEPPNRSSSSFLPFAVHFSRSRSPLMSRYSRKQWGTVLREEEPEPLDLCQTCSNFWRLSRSCAHVRGRGKRRRVRFSHSHLPGKAKPALGCTT